MPQGSSAVRPTNGPLTFFFYPALAQSLTITTGILYHYSSRNFKRRRFINAY